MARSDSPKDSSTDSSKKVAKAAKAGATPSANVGREQRSLGFPLAFAGIVVLGSALVAFAWGARDVQALTPTFGDHWHIPYGVYDCREEGFVEPFADNGNPGAGIHTHMDGTGLVGDSVVHLHPQSSTATGNNARLKGLFETVTASITDDDEITFPDRPALSAEGVTCDGEPAIMQVARFEVGGSVPIEIITEDIGEYRFNLDFEPFVIALAPEGAEIPPPPDAAFEGASAASPFVQTTTGLDGLTDLDADNIDGNQIIGFDDQGVLVDGEGNPILDGEGNEITQASIDAEAEAQSDESGDADSEESDG